MSGYTPQSLPSRLVAATRVRGVRPVAGDFLRWSGRVAAGLPRTRAGSGGEFGFDGERYAYLYGAYKRSWVTERAIEVPIVQRAVDAHPGGQVLEVGNVLSHYRPQRHTIVDKYEQAPGVHNLDVFDLASLEQEFELVVAVSTIEHVGWDEDPRVPGKAVDALCALYERVAPGGRLLLTIPAGYNPSLDEALRAGAVAFTSLAGMRRQGGGTSWRQTPPDEAWSAPYDFLLYSARGVLIASLERPPASTPPRA